MFSLEVYEDFRVAIPRNKQNIIIPILLISFLNFHLFKIAELSTDRGIFRALLKIWDAVLEENS